MNYWSDKFSELPKEIRHIACASSIGSDINALLREKKRLKTRYDQSLKEINAHIKSLEHYKRTNFPEPIKGEEDGS